MSHVKDQAQSVEQSVLDNDSLNSRYRRKTARVFLTSTQTLVHLPLIQCLLDINNLKTAPWRWPGERAGRREAARPF